MRDFQNIINEIQTKINIYQFDEKEKSFVVDEECDKTVHSLVFNDITTILHLLTKYKINYNISEKDFSIKLDY